MTYLEQIQPVVLLYEMLTNEVRDRFLLTRMEFDILMFLHNNPQYRSAGDIVRVRHLTKSHVSTTVATLEQKGLLKRSYAEGNRKSIQLTVAEAAEDIITMGSSAQNTFREALLKGFSPKDIRICEELFMRMHINAFEETERRKQ